MRKLRKILIVFLVAICVVFLNINHNAKKVEVSKTEITKAPVKKTVKTPRKVKNKKQPKQQETAVLYDTLNEIIQKEEKLNAFLSESNDTEINDKNFYEFYKYLAAKQKTIAPDVYKLRSEINSKRTVKYKGVEFSLIDGSKGIYKITNPKTSLFIWQSNDDFQIFQIDYSYLYSEYGEFLSLAWQKYLHLSTANKIPNNVDGRYNITKSQLKDWIIVWRDFADEYPDFELKNIIKNNIKNLTLNFINISYGYDLDTLDVSENTREVFEQYLAESNSSNIEYGAVLRAYEILRDNGFKYSDEYEKYYKKMKYKFE